MVKLFGILNLTRDSFSDGGRFMEPGAAVAHALRLAAEGADVIDVGAESTHPDAEAVSADEEIARLTPVIERLRADGLRVSVDTYKPAVIRHVLRLGVEYINDVTALRDPEAVAAVHDSDVRIVLMHSVSQAARAERVRVEPEEIVERVCAFFRRKVAELQQAGIAPERLILDPGMGLFLGTSTAASLRVLRDLWRLVALGRPVLISTSRKSMTGARLVEGAGEGAAAADPAGAAERRVEYLPVAERGPGTLASELWAAAHGAAYIRTHDVKSLRRALMMWDSIARGHL